MRRFIICFMAFTTFGIIANAQNATLDAAKKALKSAGDKKEKLMEAEKAIEAALAAPENQSGYEAYLLKAQLQNKYATMDDVERTKNSLMQKAYKSVTPMAGINGANALISALKNTKDPKALKEIVKLVPEVFSNLRNYGGELTEAKDFANGFNSFKLPLDIHSALKVAGQKSPLDDAKAYADQIYWAGLLSTYADKEKESGDLYKKMIELKKDTSWVYNSLYKLNKDSDEAAAVKYLEEGRAKYPEDNQLLFTEINHYLNKGNLNVLIDKLKQGIAKEPSNVSLVSTLGNVYDNLAQQTAEKDPAKAEEYNAEAVKYFNKTLEMDPNNVDAIYALGAGFYNKAAKISQAMKKIESDFSKDGQKKYAEMEKNMMAEFDKALPYFQKAESKDANDRNTLIALKEIYARKNDLEKSKEFKNRLQNIEDKVKNEKSYFKQ